MINRTVLVGRLTRDPELKYTANGVAVVSFTVAVNRQFTNANGEHEADFISCVIWRKAAENFTKFTHKGSLVGIDGRIQTRHYDNEQGKRVYITEVIGDNFSLLESRNESNSNNSNRNNRGDINSYSDSPAENSQKSNDNQTNSNDPFKDNSKPIDISDDDLPF